MKINLISNDGCAKKIFIKRSNRIRDIKAKLSKSDKNYSLIFKNLVLNDEKLIGFYHIGSSDEIWFGTIDEYFKKYLDYIIVDVFLLTMWTPGELVHLIVNMDECIRDILSILNRIILTNLVLCDVDGMRLDNDQLIGDIDVGNKGRLVICKLEFIAEIPVEECCNIYDRYLMKLINWSEMTDWNVPIAEFINEITAFGNDGISKDYLENIVKCLRFSRVLCCTIVADQIWKIYEHHRHGDDSKQTFDISRQKQLDWFEKMPRLPVYVAVLDCLKESVVLGDSVDDNESLFSTIIRRAMKYMVLFSRSDCQHLPSKFINHLGFLPVHDYDWINDAIKPDMPVFEVHYFGSHSSSKIHITKSVATIFNLILAICMNTGEESQRIYLVDKESDSKPKDDDQINPDKLNRYFCHILESGDNIEKVKPIGQGSFGSISLYRDRESQVEFVLKRPVDGDLYKEIVAYAILADSTEMILCNGLVDDGGTICIGMDYKSGGSLDDYIKKRTVLQEHEIAKISRQILIQISDMHRRGVIHRDIKPDNIVLDENGDAFVIDFGLSKIVNGCGYGDLIEIANTSPPGTAHYAAPELINGQPFTEKIDTWSFGATVVEMLTGSKPYSNLSNYEVMKVVGMKKVIQFSAPYNMSKELGSFINSCLASEPIGRPTMDELLKLKILSTYQ